MECGEFSPLLRAETRLGGSEVNARQVALRESGDESPHSKTAAAPDGEAERARAEDRGIRRGLWDRAHAGIVEAVERIVAVHRIPIQHINVPVGIGTDQGFAAVAGGKS